MSIEENDINTNENTIRESNDITTNTDNNLNEDTIEKKSLESNEDEEDDMSSIISQTNFKRSHSAPINVNNLPEIDFEVLDNSFLDKKEIKSLYDFNENLIKKLQYLIYFKIHNLNLYFQNFNSKIYNK